MTFVHPILPHVPSCHVTQSGWRTISLVQHNSPGTLYDTSQPDYLHRLPLSSDIPLFQDTTKKPQCIGFSDCWHHASIPDLPDTSKSRAPRCRACHQPRPPSFCGTTHPCLRPLLPHHLDWHHLLLRHPDLVVFLVTFRFLLQQRLL